MTRRSRKLNRGSIEVPTPVQFRPRRTWKFNVHLDQPLDIELWWTDKPHERKNIRDNWAGYWNVYSKVRTWHLTWANEDEMWEKSQQTKVVLNSRRKTPLKFIECDSVEPKSTKSYSTTYWSAVNLVGKKNMKFCEGLWSVSRRQVTRRERTGDKSIVLYPTYGYI